MAEKQRLRWPKEGVHYDQLSTVCVQPATVYTCICTHSHTHAHPCVSGVPAEISDTRERWGYRQELSREQSKGQSVLVTLLTTGTANLTKAARKERVRSCSQLQGTVHHGGQGLASGA